MLIEIRCLNFSNFDASLGRYVECGEPLMVTSDQLGELVTCTKCKQQVEVPYDAVTNPAVAPTRPKPSEPPLQPVRRTGQKGTPAPGEDRPSGQSPRRPNKAAAAVAPQRPASKTRPTPSQTARSQAPNNQTAAKHNGQPRRRSPKATPVPGKQAAALAKNRDLMSMDFGDQEMPAIAEDRKVRCKKCGNICKDGQCTVCKFVEPKYEKLYQPLNQIEIELTGFQRWFCKTMNEGVSVKVLEYVSHVLLGMLGTIFVLASVLGFSGVGIGPVGGVILLLFVITAGVVYISFVFKGRQFLRDPNAQLAWFQKPFWNMVLGLARMMRWQAYDSQLKGRRILKVRDSLFGDNDIAQLEGIKTCQVLDLQGTVVTDRGLLDLYDLKHLQCLILKGTNVTHQAVFRLQQSFPRLWIWY